MRQYSDDEMLQLSGIQHFVFCPRQWALIHIEQLWDDNHLTAEGTLQHSNVDDPFTRETNGSEVITLRGLRIASSRLGLSGIADALELHPLDNAPTGKDALLRSKLYTAIPIEYKHGSRKASDCDRIQVAAQAMALEEMMGIRITQGAIFYWKERHREYFEISDELRMLASEVAHSMHRILESGTIPKAKARKGCKSCSLLDSCLPAITTKSASEYCSAVLSSLNHDDEETA